MPRVRFESEWPTWAARCLPTLFFIFAVAFPYSGNACVGEGCLRIWSTEDGGGALTMQWDFAQKIPTFKICCNGTPDCIYTNIDPGFMAPLEEIPGSGYHALVDGTTVIVEIVMSTPGLAMSLNGQRLDQPGEQAVIGTMPDVHNHPSWQLQVPCTELGDYDISFRLKARPPSVYADSEVLTLIVTNVTPTPPAGTPTPTPTASPTATPLPCDGDCDQSTSVTVDEILICVNMALGTDDQCHACDEDDSGAVTVDEIITAVNMALEGCPESPVIMLAEVQNQILTPKCAIAQCHDAASANGNLVLEEGASEAQLVNVVPTVPLAAQAGQLRVDPGRPEKSFLLIKLTGPPPGAGSRMPLDADPLPSGEIQLITDWILQGAQP
jgi:hypothetical protein